MAKTNDAGVYQKENGYWEYRFKIMIDGKEYARRKSTDAFGNKLKTKRDAIQAREEAILLDRDAEPWAFQLASLTTLASWAWPTSSTSGLPHMPNLTISGYWFRKHCLMTG